MRAWTSLLSLALLVSTTALTMAQTTVHPPETAAAAAQARELAWHELAPPDQARTVDQMIGDVDHLGGPADPILQDTRAVAAMEGRTATLSGYLVPIATDSQRRIVELFLVPYYGACIHVPPPPANQIVHIRPSQPLPAGELWDAYRVTGKLRIATTANETATAVYAMDLQRIELIPHSGNQPYRWLGDGIMIVVFLAFLFAVKAIERWDPTTRANP